MTYPGTCARDESVGAQDDNEGVRAFAVLARPYPRA